MEGVTQIFPTGSRSLVLGKDYMMSTQRCRKMAALHGFSYFALSGTSEVRFAEQVCGCYCSCEIKVERMVRQGVEYFVDFFDTRSMLKNVVCLCFSAWF